MKPILPFAEQSVFFIDPNLPSITDMPTNKRSDKDKCIVIDYLTRSEFKRTGVPAMCGKDAFTGETLDAVGEMFSDGEYVWYDSLPEYVRLHDVALPQEFVDKVISMRH